MTDQKVDRAAKPTDEPPASTVAEKAFENEGGPSRAGSPTARRSEPIMDRIERSAGRIKTKLTARGR